MSLTSRPAAALALLAASCGGRAGPDPTAPTATASPSALSPARPNIVFILTDDQDASVENMPRLRSLVAEQGLAFDHHFVSNPLCAPSRATLLTGLHAHTHGVLANRAPNGGFERFRDNGLEASTVATWLRAAGYCTGIVGKYMNRYPGDAPGSDRAYVPPGWDLFAAFFAPDLTSGRYYDYFVNLNGDVTFYPERAADYITDQLTRVTLGALDALPASDAPPFFLHVTPNAPHSPPEPAPRHKGIFAGLQAPRTGAFNEADMSDKPPYYRNLPLMDQRTLDRLDALYAARQETLQAVDELVEALVRRLEERGQLANTYIFFSSDNGFMLGQHRFPNGKDTPYDESIRVPLVVRGPGVPRGAVRADLISNVDLPVTFAELGGAAPPATVEGRSFAALLREGAGAFARSEVLLEHWGDDADSVPSYAGLRTREYTYVEYETGDVEFYNLRDDPGQEENLADKVDPALLATLARRLQVLRACRGAACR
jgi:arylsulfatase A-like enzyme